MNNGVGGSRKVLGMRLGGGVSGKSFRLVSSGSFKTKVISDVSLFFVETGSTGSAAAMLKVGKVDGNVAGSVRKLLVSRFLITMGVSVGCS